MTDEATDADVARRGRLLVTPGELVVHLGDPGWKVIDCRFNLMAPEAGHQAFLAGHIPGARYADLDRDLAGPRRRDSGRHPLPDPEFFRGRLAGWGLHPASRVVAYDDAGGAIAARLWWLLRWLGHPDVALLDGGFQAWQRAGLPLEAGPAGPTPRPADFPGSPGQMPVVDAAEVAAAVPTGRLRLVDVRAPERFAGRTEPIDPVAGHVPGAVNVPFGRNLARDGSLLPLAELRALYAPVVDGRSPGTVAFMCGSGVTACFGIFALELAGWAGGRLYPGSWSEWIRSPDRPVGREGVG